MKNIDIEKVKTETYEETKEFEDNRDQEEQNFHVYLIYNLKENC
jgi:hypothetical protein